MNIPTGADVELETESLKQEATIRNTYANKEMLTAREALDLINWLSARLLVDTVPDQTQPEEVPDDGC